MPSVMLNDFKMTRMEKNKVGERYQEGHAK